MKIKAIEKININDLLKETAKDWNVYAPQRNLGGDIWFDVLPKPGADLDKALESMVLDDLDIVISSKDAFFPQLESLFRFNNGKIREIIESSPKLLFAVQPCDLKGILFADAFFKRNLEDKYYLSRIENRFIVVIGCLKPPRPTCFCTSAMTGPFAREGFDLQLVDYEDSYLVETGSKAGEEFILKFKKYFKDPPRDFDKTIDGVKSKAAGSVELKVDFQKAFELMGQENFIPEENYKRIGERCIYCGGCLYVCPTCTCFNVFDNSTTLSVNSKQSRTTDNFKDKTGERLRNWDGCVFEGYTRETSGHNPRREKWQRASRRYEHKLKYDYQVTGASGCVGCGRCLSSCPVDIGMSKFIQEITEERKIM